MCIEHSSLEAYCNVAHPQPSDSTSAMPSPSVVLDIASTAETVEARDSLHHVSNIPASLTCEIRSSISDSRLLCPDHVKSPARSYQGHFKSIEDLTIQERRSMASLYLSYYDGSSEDVFESDLNNKTEVLFVECEGQLAGFTTIATYEREWGGQPILVVFSGDTIIDQLHWGQQALAFNWIARMGRLRFIHPGKPIYWFLIVKGHRTFKYLPAFCNSFYPHWSLDRSDLKPLADVLAHERFGNIYNPITGIVEFPTSRGHLRSDISYPDERASSKEAVKFFLEKNPKFYCGHELVCLCEIKESNMKPLARRIFLKGIS